MRLEWLDDILAVIETGSFNAAAEKRLLTQPAFSRRIRAIEAYVGVELFDRTHKPVRLRPTLRDREPAIKEMASGLRDLLFELRRQDRETHNRLVIAAQHAITTARAPELVRALSERIDVSIRLRSANRDECLALLLTKQADLTITYRTEGDALPIDEDLLEFVDLGRELLIPVFAAAHLKRLNESYAAGELPVVAYPNEAFLGRVFNRAVLPGIDAEGYVRRKVETALTVAALQFALAGIAVAWVPSSLVAAELARGDLCDLSEVLPTAELLVTAMRLRGPHAPTEQPVWAFLCEEDVLARAGGRAG